MYADPKDVVSGTDDVQENGSERFALKTQIWSIIESRAPRAFYASVGTR
jgi:hypothetical protein